MRALKRHAKQLWAAVPDARVNSTGARLCDGRFVAAPCRLLGTHEGELARIHPTNKPLEIHAVVYAEIEDEQLLRVRVFFDLYARRDAPRRASQARHARASARCCCCAASASEADAHRRVVGERTALEHLDARRPRARR